MKKRLLAILLACVFLVAGFFTTYRVFSQFRRSIIDQHEEMLTDTANSVDRSIQGYLRIHRDSLDYVTGRRGFLEAEAAWAETGNVEELMLRMEENLLTQDLRIKSFLAIHDGEVILSTDGDMGYMLPEELTDLFICRDESGAFYFGMLKSHEALSYAAVLELDVLCDYLAESSAVSDTDRMMLIDPDGQIVIQYMKGQTTASVLTREIVERSPAVAAAVRAVDASETQVSFYEAEEDGRDTTVGYVLIGVKAGINGFFNICILDAYDAYLDDLRWETVQLTVSCAMIMLGLTLLMSYAGSLSRENRKANVELRRLNQRQKALEEINRQTRDLAHHQRLETIGTLTSSISHEFNNLLTPIMGYSLLTLEKLPPGEEELADNLIEIYNASEKAKQIISRLSDLSRKNSPNTFRAASVDALVRKALDIAMPARPEGVEVKLNLNCWDQRIRANEIQICQLMLNLILNAFHAMGSQGVLMIETGFDDHFVDLQVSDNGCGIPKENLDRIFDPFFTTKDSGKGTGLGLAIAAQVVEDHQGTIRVESKPGQGTRFTVRLPRMTETE